MRAHHEPLSNSAKVLVERAKADKADAVLVSPVPWRKLALLFPSFDHVSTSWRVHSYRLELTLLKSFVFSVSQMAQLESRVTNTLKLV